MLKKKLNLFYSFSVVSCLLRVLPKQVLTVFLSSSFVDSIYLYNFGKFDIFVFKFFLKSSFFRLQSLVEFTSVDFLSLTYRFLMVYSLLSLSLNKRYLICMYVSDFQHLPSLVCLYRSSNWLEREVYDMFGCWFVNHPDLRRILTDYGFDGFPLRKDFPVSGYYEVFYDVGAGSLRYSAVSITQSIRQMHAFRLFS